MAAFPIDVRFTPKSGHRNRHVYRLRRSNSCSFAIVTGIRRASSFLSSFVIASFSSGGWVSATRTRSRGPNSFDSNTRVLCSHTHIRARNHISAPAEPDAVRNNQSSRAVLCRLVVPGRQAALHRQSVECKPGRHRWVARRRPVQAPHKLGLRSRSQAANAPAAENTKVTAPRTRALLITISPRRALRTLRVPRYHATTRHLFLRLR